MSHILPFRDATLSPNFGICDTTLKSNNNVCFLLFSPYQNGWRDANSLRTWAFQYLPSKVIELDTTNFSTLVLRDSKPWLIDFYGMCII